MAKKIKPGKTLGALTKAAAEFDKLDGAHQKAKAAHTKARAAHTTATRSSLKAKVEELIATTPPGYAMVLGKLRKVGKVKKSKAK